MGLEENSSDVVDPETSFSPKLIPTVSTQLSPGELIIKSKAKTNAQKITVLGSYLVEKENTDSFLIKEIQLQLKKMGEHPGNFTRDLKTAVSSQYIYPVDSKTGKYGLTEKGKDAIKNTFPEEMTSKIGTKRNVKYKKPTPPRQEVLDLPIVTALNGYPDFHKVPAKADSILWVLAYADTNSIDGLTPREVETLTDKLKNKIMQKDFSAHNKRNIKSGYVAITDGKFKIQQKGIDFLLNLMQRKPDENK